jgi:hypothetical protein
MDHGGSQESEHKLEPDNNGACQVKIRLPAALKAWLQRRAAANRRTLNAEVVVRLEETQKQEASDAKTPA